MANGYTPFQLPNFNQNFSAGNMASSFNQASGGNSGGLNLSSLSSFGNTQPTQNPGMNFGGNQLPQQDNMWGNVGSGIGALQGIANTWLAMKQYGLAEDQFDFQRDAYQRDYANQAKLTNQQLADRQAARLAYDPDAYGSIADTLAQYGVNPDPNAPANTPVNTDEENRPRTGTTGK